ncbi:MAG: RNA polymerase sporulation sigma factor SigG [Ruminococcaceae bacterium]|nr:RNA polymerase sporulation sigma factor SigG [Oscillospiraceae bacterium]
MNKVEICGVNTAKLPILNSEKKTELLKRVKAGDKEAKDEFIEGNLRLVLSVIQRFSGRGEHVDDLFQVGCVGLIKAMENFDLTLGVQFSTYAVPMIIGEIRRYLRDNNAIRVSRSLRDTAYRALKTKEELTNKTGQEPTAADIAKEMGLETEEVVFALNAIADPVSLFEPVYHDGEDAAYIVDQVKDSKNSDENWIQEIALRQAMENLSEREKHILQLRFYRGRTQMEVAEEIGISQAQVSRLEKSALMHMRKWM